MEFSFMVIGLSRISAPPEVCARFWIPEIGRHEAQVELKRANGIEEVIILSTSDRTDFLLWVSDASAASNSVLAFLTHRYGLRLCEWEKFYRKLDEQAVVHVFRLVCGLESGDLDAGNVVSQLCAAWSDAQQYLASGPWLDTLLAEAVRVSRREGGPSLSAHDEIQREVQRFCANMREIESPRDLSCWLQQMARVEIEQARSGDAGIDEVWVDRLAKRLADRMARTMLRDLNQGGEKRQQVRASLQQLLQPTPPSTSEVNTVPLEGNS